MKETLLTVYMATKNRTGILKQVLRIHNNMVIGIKSNIPGIINYFSPPIPLGNLGNGMDSYIGNCYPTYEIALEQYIQMQRDTISMAEDAIRVAENSNER